MTSTNASPSSTPFITRLPFELLSEIFQKVEREDLAQLYATTRTFSRIVRPLLFRDLSFRTAQSISSSLLGIAGTPELADLVRNLNVSFNLKPPQKPEDRDQILNIIAISLISFRTLERVSSMKGWRMDEQFFINDSLQLAIFLHPTLRSLSYEGWHSSLTSYNTSFRRTQSHPLIIQRLCYEYHPYRPDVFEPHQFYSTILPFISHFECQVQLLELSSLQPDGFPLPLLLETPIAGLEHLSIISSEGDRPPDLLTKTDWLARFLKLHPVRTLRLVRTDTGNQEEINLPWLAFSFVKGLEVFSDKELVNWEQVDAIEDLQVQFSEGEEGEVHGLDLELLGEYIDVPLTTSTVQGLVQAFPNLRRLEFYGSYSTPGLHENISALAGLQHLSELRVASHLLEEGRRSFCHHQAELFLEELDRDDASDESTLRSFGVPLDSQTREDLRLRLLTADLHRPRKLSWFVDEYEEDWRTLFEKLPRLEGLNWALEVGRSYGAREGLCARRRDITSSSIFDVESEARLKRVVCWCDPRTTSDDWISMLLARPPLFR